MATQMNMEQMRYLPGATNTSQKVAVLEEPGRIGIRHAETPEPDPDQVRIRLKWVGICGSDLEEFRGNRAPEFVATPMRLGHEVAGVIDKVGDRVVGLRPGQQVTCRYVWGAFAEAIICSPFNVRVLPNEIPLKEASLVEVLPAIIHAAELGEIDSTKDVLIMGQGVSGLILTQVVHLYSPKNLVVTDLRERNLALAKRYGATHCYRLPSPDTPTMQVVGADFPGGFDVVIPCFLEGDGMIDAVDSCTMGAKLVMYGCLGLCRKPFDFFKVERKRLEMLTTAPKRDIDMRRFLDEGMRMVADGLVNTGEMITHTFGLDDIQEAFDLRNDKSDDAIHVMIDCEV